MEFAVHIEDTDAYIISVWSAIYCVTKELNNQTNKWNIYGWK